jgi:exonuclease SbcD
MKILHTADIHLKEYEDERWQTLQRLIEIGKKEKIEMLVISGDLFDKGIDAENLRPKIRDIFSNNGFKIIIIPGNHDSESYEGGMYFGEDAIILTDLNDPFEYGDVRIWGLPFEPIEGEKILSRLQSLASKLTPSNKHILVYHGELLDAFLSRRDFGDEGDKRYMPVRLSYFEDLNIDYVLGGHFHSIFDVRRLKNGGYFVYPGSPISITKRETGRRKVNIFEVGGPPHEYALSTPYFEEIDIAFDPYKDKQPLERVIAIFSELSPEAKVILTIGGYINGNEIGMDESQIVKRINEITEEKCVDRHYEFKDIQIVLEDDLYKNFMNKLEQTDYEEEKKRYIQDMAIKAMVGSKL